MDEVLPRLLLVGLLTLAAVGVGLVMRRIRPGSHPPIDVSALDLAPGIVAFTSTDCVRCKEAVALAKGSGVPFREYTYELEAGVLEQVGVAGVPLVLVVGDGGEVVRQFSGVPSRRALRRAIARAGL